MLYCGEHHMTCNNQARDKANSKLQFISLRQKYPHYEHQDLANHPAIVYIPYQVSVMSFFEQYRMNVPIFAPSVEFFARLHIDYAVISERTWARVRGRGSIEQSDIPKHVDYNRTNFDPNNDVDEESLFWWLKLSDFYTKPHIIHFSSWDDLIDKLQTTDLNAVSKRMVDENERFSLALKKQWRWILRRIFANRPPSGYDIPRDYDEGLLKLYPS